MSRASRLLGAVALALALVAGGFAPLQISAALAASLPAVATAPFDYYVMTLSWSPGFCDLGGEAESPQQCAAGAGNGFVVHGLWPDNRRGPDPEDCGHGRLASAELSTARGLYPTTGLAAYEYRKHGSCTGLGARDYFATVRYVRDQLVVPPLLQAPRESRRLSPRDIERAFIDANANLKPTNMAITCIRGELVDVRFCVARDLRAFATCPKVASRTCRSDMISVAPLR